MVTLRAAEVYVDDVLAGFLKETDEGYTFNYVENYNYKPVSLTLPIQSKEYVSKTLFPFFDGLIPEGWLLNVVINNWKINPRDRFSLLLCACKDPIGNVKIIEAK